VVTDPPPPAPARSSRTARSAARTGGTVTRVQQAQGEGEALNQPLPSLLDQPRPPLDPDQRQLGLGLLDPRLLLLPAPSSSDHPGHLWGLTLG